MTRFKDQPIARKALFLGLVPTLCAVVLVVTLSTFATFVQSRATLIQDLATESSIVAANVSAALAFNDRRAAADTASAFRAKGNIDAVCVFDASGRLFASFVQGAGACPAHQDTILAARATMIHEQAITFGARDVGRVRLVGNFSRLYAWMRRQLLVALSTLIAGVLLSLILTRWLGRAITAPVLNLAKTADRVSKSGDYSMRATQTTDDELGRLAQSFNTMLGQIQRQHDISSALLEREQETSRMKDQFLAAVSHELRTPLNAILGWVQIIRTTNPSEQTRERAFESLERNAHAQARMIEDLIEVSRVVTGKLHLKAELVDLRAVIKAALEVIGPTMNSKGIQLSVALVDAPVFVTGDADRLQQVVWNLLSNAIKFTPSGGKVTIALETTGSDVVLRVEDTGVGISPEFLPFVFDRFRQADGSMTREHGGLGLGLAIVKELTELHGGAVSAASGGKGLGTTFTVRLPRAAATSRPQPPLEGRSVAACPPDALAGVRVLAVDDDPDALAVLCEALKAHGATVATAASAPEAIATWGRESFNVLVSDLAMPGLDGYAILRAIRERGQSDDALAIALTAHVSREDRRRSLAAGFSCHLAKPYELNDLIESILAGLRDRRQQQA